ncbi:hypothetical protein [Sorangium sp. So ce128]|uniref:hypothetical protein n=1 Tax=Sorangium sp. So ce128 TaxID=3133281 RepID=UPI003F6327C2
MPAATPAASRGVVIELDSSLHAAGDRTARKRGTLVSIEIVVTQLLEAAGECLRHTAEIRDRMPDQRDHQARSRMD